MRIYTSEELTWGLILIAIIASLAGFGLGYRVGSMGDCTPIEIFPPPIYGDFEQ